MNPMQKVRIEKLTLNVGAGTDQKSMDKGIKLIKYITGIEPVKTKTEKRIPAWNLRPGLPIGCKLTLRGQKATDLLVRLLKAKQNKLKPSCFDQNGNLSFGIHEYIDIPGVEYSPEIGIFGLQASVTVTKPGYRVAKRQKRTAKVGSRHRITQEESMNFFKEEFGVTVEGKE